MTAPLVFEGGFSVGEQIEARAAHPIAAGKILLMHGERRWTYRQFRDESVRMAHFLLRRLGPIDDARPGHVAMIMENHLELLALYGGCAYGGLTLFGVNTGLRGEVLAGVLNHSGARVLVVDEGFLPEVERVRDRLRHLAAENILVLRTRRGDFDPSVDLEACVEREIGAAGRSLDVPGIVVTPDRNLMVIYTSGTTGLPKGINNTHAKLCAIGMAVAGNCGFGADDVGYACMPLFHSNSIFLGFMPAFWVGGSLALRERFSASQFVPDVFNYGVTFWNYVGEPVHYVLGAVEKEYGGDEDRIAREITNNPRNHFRYALGNGAPPPDIDRFSRWFGLEEMFETYGSTEAAISTFRRRGDPRGSCGEIFDPAVRILDAEGRERPPARLGPDGQVLNYAECVGEICRVSPDTGLFQGYFGNSQADADKVREGVYHSGDLGHILVVEGHRFLCFDGRTDDWIRKDGENFSANQVGRMVAQYPPIALAVAYGVPCAVSDELVMVAIKLRPGATFDPVDFFAWCERQVSGGSMDRKWMPDFVRVVEDFQFTQTQKILVRLYKVVHFDLNRLPEGEPIFWRERGDKAFKPFTRAGYDRLRGDFQARERLALLDR